MEIRDASAHRFVRLEPVGYQFPHLRGVEFDSDWLIVSGRARSDDEEWSFQDPVLLVDEARDVGSWLRAAAGRTAPLLVPGDDGRTWPATQHIEPNLGLGVASYGRDAIVVRVFLRLESAPPSTWSGGGKTDMDFFMDLTTVPEALERAADDWDASLAKIPRRS
ncbi:MAG: hypothetical protein J0H23_08595 [Micrococcales bacterium]|nr:hypothetical protein [Micrococcales bacterium]OJX67295.1 MAG: hypothetical protein BGO94_00165 [Micrococcales bacterium 72-143]